MERGHKLDQIKNYSVKKFRLILEAISKIENDQIKMMAMSVRAASMEEKDWKKFIKG